MAEREDKQSRAGTFLVFSLFSKGKSAALSGLTQRKHKTVFSCLLGIYYGSVARCKTEAFEACNIYRPPVTHKNHITDVFICEEGQIEWIHTYGGHNNVWSVNTKKCFSSAHLFLRYVIIDNLTTQLRKNKIISEFPNSTNQF